MTERQTPPSAGRVFATPSFVLLARGLVLVFNTAVVVVLARVLGQEDFGRYAYVQGYTLILDMLSVGGVFVVLIRELSRQPEAASELVGTGLVLQLAVVAAIFGPGLILVPLLARDAVISAGIRIVALSYAMLIPANLFSSVFVARGRAEYMALSVLVERSAYVAVLAALLLRGAGLLAILWAQVASAAVQLVFAWTVTVRRFVPMPWSVRLKQTLPLLRAALPLSISEGLRALDQQLGVLLLQWLRSAGDVGLFGAPARLILRLNIIPDSLMRGLLPVLSQTQQRRFGKLAGMLLGYSLIAASTIAAVAGPLGPRLAMLLFGNGYAAAGPTVTVLACAVVPLFVAYALKYLLVALGQQKFETAGLAVALLCHAAVVVLLAPRWGPLAAALGFAISQVVFCGLAGIVVLRQCPLAIDRRQLLRGGLVVAALALLMGWIARSSWWLWLGGAAWLLAVAALFALRVFSLAELRAQLTATEEAAS